MGATLRETAEKLGAELSNVLTRIESGEGSAEDRATAVTLTNEVIDAKAAVDAANAGRDAVRSIDAMSEAGNAVRDAAEVEKTADGRPVNTQGRTFGELFAGSKQYESFLSAHAGRDGVIPSSTKGLNSGTFQSGINIKNLITGTSGTSGGALVEEDRKGGITDLAQLRERSVLDVITMGSTNSDAVEYVRVTGKTNNAAPVAEATTADLPTQDASTGPLINAAGGGYKPQSGLALEVVTTNVKTIAHWEAITKRAASDAAQVMTLVNAFLMEGVYEEMENQVIAGDGTGENFDGLENNSDVLTVGSAGTDLDAIVDAIRTVRVTGRRRPTAIVIHPNDWYSTGFVTAKASDGQYLVADPRASVDALQTLWGLQVVVSEGVTENQAIVGDFRQAVLWEREGVQVTMTDSHADFFVRNLLATLAEARAAFGLLDPAAFCKVTAI